MRSYAETETRSEPDAENETEAESKTENEKSKNESGYPEPCSLEGLLNIFLKQEI